MAGNDRNLLEEQLEILERRATEQESTQRAITQENELAENAIVVLKTRISELEAADNAVVTSLKSQVAQLVMSQRDQQDELEILTTAKEAAIEQLTNLKQTISDLQEELAVVTKKHLDLATLSADAKAVADRDIVALRAQGKQDTEEISALKTRVYGLEAALQDTDEQLTSMTVKYNDATAACAAGKIKADEELDQVSKQALELAMGKAAAAEEIDALTKSLEEMHACIEYLEKKIAAAEVSPYLFVRLLLPSFLHMYPSPLITFRSKLRIWMRSWKQRTHISHPLSWTRRCQESKQQTWSKGSRQRMTCTRSLRNRCWWQMLCSRIFRGN